MDALLLMPPVAFLVILVVMIGSAWAASRFALHPAKRAAGTLKAYACGETMANNRPQPDYSQFFPFAFFFTIMHVIALILATVPADNARILGLAVLYVLAAAVGLLILYRS